MGLNVFFRVDIQKFLNTSDVNIGYLAGILDGEAAFVLHRQGKDSPYFEPVVVIGMTDRRVFDKFVEMGIACKVAVRRRFSRPHMKTMYYGRFYANDLRVILPKVIDHLVIKKGQAKILLRVLELCFRRRDTLTGRWKSPLKEEIEEVTRLKARITELNKRGI